MIILHRVAQLQHKALLAASLMLLALLIATPLWGWQSQAANFNRASSSGRRLRYASLNPRGD